MVTLAMSVQFPATPAIAGHIPTSTARLRPTPAGKTLTLSQHPKLIRVQKHFISFRAIEKSRESFDSPSEELEIDPGAKPELTQLGSEIKAAMEEKKAAAAAVEEEGLLAGVSSEIKEIEWPAFGKVLGTTWVVLGIIAGSSVVLLTLNVVLAELSDKVFAGRGVQDFFG